MCVRACDGFYFPIRQNAHRQSFSHDAIACTSACGAGARIFYFPASRGDAGSMIDLEGKRYLDEPHAFRFRKVRDPACTCKPAPWSKEAVGKHHAYAETEAAERSRLRRTEEERELAAAAKASAELSSAASKAYYSE